MVLPLHVVREVSVAEPCSPTQAHPYCAFGGVPGPGPVALTLRDADFVGAQRFFLWLEDLDVTNGCAGAGACLSFEDGQFPNGFTEPANSDRPWAVDNSSAGTGTMSMRSGSINAGQLSCVSYAAAAASFSVSFSVRADTSSLNAVRFLVDGVEQESFSADPAWQRATIATALATGHTFTWCYDKFFSDTQTADRVWIDDVEVR